MIFKISFIAYTMTTQFLISAMSTSDLNVVIVGGGIAGLATAVALCRSGVRGVRIFEKTESMRPIGAAIGLFPNGLRALNEISPRVHERVLESAIRTRRYVMCNLDGDVVRDKEGRGNTTLLVWYLLQQYLADELNDGILTLGARVTQVEQDSISVRVHVMSNGKLQIVRCRVLVGADGIWSRVRTNIFGEGRPPRYHGKLMFRSVLPRSAIKDGICPPAGIQRSFAGDEKGKLFALRETAKGLITVTAMARMEDDKVFHEAEEKRNRLKKVFAQYPADVHEVIESMDADCIFEHAVYDVEEVASRWSQGRVVIIGDAVHAMTPGLGQGANQGLEDACELAHFLTKVLVNVEARNEEIESTLERFSKLRFERVREIHARSRRKTANVNESTLESRLNRDANAIDAEDFRKRVYNWQPTVVVEREQRQKSSECDLVETAH